MTSIETTGNSQACPRLSVLIPWCDRPEIRTALEHNVPILRQFDAELLILNCGGDSGELKRLCSGSESLRCTEIRRIDLPRSRFNRCYALNVGVYLSRSSIIFTLDADIILNAEIVRDAMEIVNHTAFVTVEKVLESQPSNELFDSKNPKPLSIMRKHFVEIALNDGTSISLCTFCRDEVDGSRAGPGLMFLKKEHLVRVGGYNADLQYWGWEDNDLQVRLTRVLNLEHREVGTVLHLSHGDESRALFGKNPKFTNRSNLGICCERYARGNFRGTYSTDVQSWLSKATE